MWQTGQEDVLKVCPDHWSNPKVFSQKINMRNCNTSANIIASMPGGQAYSIDSYLQEENSHTGLLMSDSCVVYLQQFFWLFAIFKSVCLTSKKKKLKDAPSPL